MLLGTTWKVRANRADQMDRMMAIWGKIEADMAERPDMRRVAWFATVDGSSGVQVVEADDADQAGAFSFEVAVALGEFLELDTRPVLDLEQAMPAIQRAMERTKV
jgi:hypothetical protein